MGCGGNDRQPAGTHRHDFFSGLVRFEFNVHCQLRATCMTNMARMRMLYRNGMHPFNTMMTLREHSSRWIQVFTV